MLFAAPGTRTRTPLQYLGFTFDGRQVMLRGSTLARQWRRLAAAIHWAKGRRTLALDGTIQGRQVVHRKALLARFSHLGADNFHTGYATQAAKAFGTRTIRRQLRNHMRFIKQRIVPP